MNYFDRSILAIAAPRLVSTLHIGEVSMGMAFSAFLLGYTLLLTPGGWLADQAGPRRVLAIACGAWALLTAATALAGAAPRFAIPPLAALIAIRFLFGASSAPLYPGCSRLAVTTIPAHRVTAVQALVVSCSAVGSAAAPFAFTRLMEGLGWQAAFCAAGLVTAGVALAWRAATHRLSDSAPVARSDAAGISRAVLANRSLLWLSASYFCINYFEYIFFYWLYYYFGQIRHFAPSLAAAASTATMLGMVFMGPGGGWLADVAARRFGTLGGRRLVAAAGMISSAGLLALGAAGFSATPTIALLAFAFGCAAAAEGPFWATAADAGGDYAASAGGFMNTVGNAGGMIAPVLTPIVAAHFGWTSALWLASAVVLTGVLAWAGVRPARSRV